MGDGAEIQYRAVPGQGEWCDEPRHLIWEEFAEYRKKPKPDDIFVQPTMLLGKDAAVYAKLGYSSQKLKLTDTTSSSSTYGVTFTNSSVSGYLVGLGYKAIFNKWWYGFAEANYYSYSAPSSNSVTANNVKYTGYTPSSSAYEGIVGIGYKF